MESRLPMAEVCGRVRAARAYKKMTQQEFADAIGVSRATLSRIEQDKRWPTRSELERISEVAGFPVWAYVEVFPDRLPEPGTIWPTLAP